MNLPNKLTALRVIMIPFFMFFLLNDKIKYSAMIALIIYVIASLTDLLDGYIARKYKLITDFGKFMDPLADKLLVISSLVCFVEVGLINSWIAMVIIARELVITGFRTLAVSKGITLAANFWGKLKTVMQMITIITILVINAGLLTILQFIISPFLYLTVILTLLSGYIYIKQNESVLR